MYRYLEGKLTVKNPAQVVIDVSGVGYELFIPLSTYQQLPPENEGVRLLTHFHVREDVQKLFGFFTEEERDLFRTLLSVSGIGPKVALTILSGIGIPELKAALVQGKPDVLTRVSGVGRKTAERLIVELRERIVIQDKERMEETLGASEGTSEILHVGLGALTQLGYKQFDARKAIEKVMKKQGPDLAVEELIREALKNM